MAAAPPPTPPDRGPAGDVEVEPLEPADAATALAVVDADQVARGASVIDEAEFHRLVRFADAGEAAPGWRPLVAHVGGQGVGYGALVADPEARTATGDAAVTQQAPDAPAVLLALLRTLSAAASDLDVDRLQVWVRQAGDTEVAAAGLAGFDVDRRLGVLGRDLGDDVTVVTPAHGWTIRGSAPADDEAIVAVLAAAYAGTDEAGWDLAQLRERQGYDWFRAEDLLVAEGPDGRLGGLHWLKRRDATQGEVYNLAIAPDAQGAGLGAALLTAGLAHLREVGCDEVILWVDRANTRAVRLYEKYGFVTRWDDIAFGRAAQD